MTQCESTKERTRKQYKRTVGVVKLHNMLKVVHAENYKPGKSGYLLRQVPLRLINIKPVRVPERYAWNMKLTRERGTMPPIYLSWNKTARLFDIADGVHRANVAKDLGYQYIPAWLPDDDPMIRQTEPV